MTDKDRSQSLSQVATKEPPEGGWFGANQGMKLDEDAEGRRQAS
jgi:hypothetical protein